MTFYRALHPAPVLVTVCAKRPDETFVPDLGSVDDPTVVPPSGVLTDPAYQAVYWNVCGLHPKRPLKSHPERRGWFTLTRHGRDTGKGADPVASLSAVWADLDLKDDDVPPYRTHGRTDYAQFLPAMWRTATDAGLPVPSLLLKSGAGLWLLWCLRDEQAKAVPDTATTRPVFEDLQARVASHFPGLVDTGASDRRRLMRIPGSWHPEVRQVVWADAGGGTYTLASLAASVPRAVPATPATAPATRPRPARTVSQRPVAPDAPVEAMPPLADLPSLWGRAVGKQHRHRRDLESLYRLAHQWGGLRKGKRHYALRVALAALRHLYPDNPSVWDAKLRQMNRDVCRPPQSETELDAMLVTEGARDAATRPQWGPTLADWGLPDGKPKAIPYATIRGWLGLTDEDAAALGVFTKRREGTPKEGRGVRGREGTALEAHLWRLRAAKDGIWPSALSAETQLRQEGVQTDSGQSYGRKRIAKVLRDMKRWG